MLLKLKSVMIKVICLLLLSFIVSGCSMLNPGYISSKPDISKLTPYQSTLSNVEDSLGDPAISQMAFGKKITYKYFYNTPDASVDQTKMIKGDYSSGCVNCGQLIATFKWGDGTDIKSFLLTGISVADNQLKSQTIDALKLIRENNFSKAYPILLKAAEGNYLLAQHTLGLMFINGDGVQKDYKTAAYWFARAASAEYPPSLYDLGAMYKNGEGIASNIDVAKDLYIRSANFGYLMAMHELVKIYSEEGDQQQADFWNKRYQAAIKK